MWAMIVKEFRQLRRDRRTLAMMIFLPIVLLIIFGYAASFDVKTIATTVVGPRASQVAGELRAPFQAVKVAPGEDRPDALAALRHGRTRVAIATYPCGTTPIPHDSPLCTPAPAQ